jgi:hypothetical protein
LYTATLTVTDKDGGVGQDSTQVEVVDTLVVYDSDEDDFGDEWSEVLTDTTPCGTGFLGEFSNQTVSLSLGDLLRHTHVLLEFDLYIIRSWDGNQVQSGSEPGSAPQIVVGPDEWDLKADQQTLLHTTFSNWTQLGYLQAFPGSFPGGAYAAQTAAAETNSLCYTFGPYDMDARYALNYILPHDQDTLVLDFSGMGLQDISDESWGLNHVKVSISATYQPPPPQQIYLPVVMMP